MAVSAVLFERGRLVWLRHLWQSGRVVPLLDTPCTNELLRVLAYPKLALTRHAIQTLLGTYLPYVEVVPQSERPNPSLPCCTDPDDEKLLALADAGGAEVLVTGDRALLEAGEDVRFRIEEPGEFRRRLTQGPT